MGIFAKLTNNIQMNPPGATNTEVTNCLSLKKAGRSFLCPSAAFIEGKKKQITGTPGKWNVYRHLVGWMGSRWKRQGLRMHLRLFSLRRVYPWQYLVGNTDGTKRANFAQSSNSHLTSWREKRFSSTRFRRKGSVHCRHGRFKYSIRISEMRTFNLVRWWICAHL